MTTDAQLETQEVLARITEEAERQAKEQTSFKELPRKALVHAGGVELPERVQVWDKYGNSSMVPTASMQYHLNKKGPDGNRVFFATRPAGLPEPTFIDEVCEVCKEKGWPKGLRPMFKSKFDLRGHYESAHQREFRVMQEEKLEKQQAAGVLGMIATMSDAQRDQLRGLLFGEEEAETPRRRGRPPKTEEGV